MEKLKLIARLPFYATQVPPKMPCMGPTRLQMRTCNMASIKLTNNSNKNNNNNSNGKSFFTKWKCVQCLNNFVFSVKFWASALHVYWCGFSLRFTAFYRLLNVSLFTLSPLSSKRRQRKGENIISINKCLGEGKNSTVYEIQMPS